ncbi:MAG: AAA family ATPase [Polyangiales bacterium]
MSVGRFLQQAALPKLNAHEVIAAEGGARALFYRPRDPTDLLRLKLTLDGGSYETKLVETPAGVRSVEESLVSSDGRSAWTTLNQAYEFTDGSKIMRDQPFSGLQVVCANQRSERSIVLPILRSRLIQLSPQAIRADAPAPDNNTVQMTTDGRGLAQVLLEWSGGNRARVTALNEFVHALLPEISEVEVESVQAEPGAGGSLGAPPPPGSKRLRVLQADGERFDARRISDGVLSLIGLAMNAIEAGPDTVLFLEEPEQFVHPTLLHGVVDLFRRVATKQKCQIVLATHSPRLLNEFRDEPESVVIFRRTATGSVTRKLSELPKLAKLLRDQDPGSMLEMGLFDKALAQATQKRAAT